MSTLGCQCLLKTMQLVVQLQNFTWVQGMVQIPIALLIYRLIMGTVLAYLLSETHSWAVMETLVKSVQFSRLSKQINAQRLESW